MKRILTLVLSFTLTLAAFENASAQMSPGLFAKKKPLPSTRGKGSIKELGKEIHTAMQTGDTERLMIFMPSEPELKDLKKNKLTPDKTKELIETVNASQLENNFKQDLATVQNQLAADSVIPEQATFSAATGHRPKIPNVIPVTVTLLDKQQRPVALTFEALKIDKRVFLFRNLQVKREMQAVNMEPAKP
ncbi:hypothetical protein [Adhaeribacter terreus]|uniref:DUF4252 domain-containing protein n=1 Tax=Adhaeribacter terreus TaxID=529703 RepID=A0ABW0EBN6_9BACT